MPDTNDNDRLYDNLLELIEELVDAGWQWCTLISRAKQAWVDIHAERLERAKEEVKNA